MSSLPDLKRVKAPTLVLQADPQMGPALSPKGAALIKRAKPDVELVMIPGAPHTMHNTHTDEFLRVLIGFLEKKPTGQ